MPNISTPSPEIARMREAANLPRTLMGGTPAMRRAGVRYLPKEARETPETYNARVARSVLFNGFAKTVRDQVGRVFKKPIVLKDDVPAILKADAENIDMAGRSQNEFARDCFTDASVTGIGFINVDMPRRPAGLPNTIAAERDANFRPFFVYLPLEAVLGWQTDIIAGVETLVQFRVLESVVVPDGDYAEKAISQVRLLEPGKWSTWRQKAGTTGQGDGDWILFEEGQTSLDKITVAPINLKRIGYMTAEPPLAELAHLNVAHWQSSSDQRNILHCARVPILFGSGFNTDDTLEVGASAMVRASSTDANLKYVEHSGAAIGAGEKEIERLEFQMQQWGLQLLVPQPGQTATGEIRDDAKEMSPLAAMAKALGDALEMALGFAAEYRGLGTDAGGSVEVNTDFGALGSADFATFVQAYRGGIVSRETVWSELKRRGILSDDFDAETEAGRLATEAPALG
jgi:hypothetical protein